MREDEQPSDDRGGRQQELPPPEADVLVDCGNYRCMAHRTRDGKWVSTYGGEELENVVAWFT